MTSSPRSGHRALTLVTDLSKAPQEIPGPGTAQPGPLSTHWPPYKLLIFAVELLSRDPHARSLAPALLRRRGHLRGQDGRPLQEGGGHRPRFTPWHRSKSIRSGTAGAGRRRGRASCRPLASTVCARAPRQRICPTAAAAQGPRCTRSRLQALPYYQAARHLSSGRRQRALGPPNSGARRTAQSHPWRMQLLTLPLPPSHPPSGRGAGAARADRP